MCHTVVLTSRSAGAAPPDMAAAILRKLFKGQGAGVKKQHTEHTPALALLRAYCPTVCTHLGRYQAVVLGSECQLLAGCLAQLSSFAR